MKYRIEHPRDNHTMIIHVEEEVIEDFSYRYDRGDKGLDYCPAIAGQFLSIKGIKEVELSYCTISLLKGQVFEWEDLMASIIVVLRVNFCKLEETGPPLHTNFVPRAHSERDVDQECEE